MPTQTEQWIQLSLDDMIKKSLYLTKDHTALKKKTKKLSLNVASSMQSFMNPTLRPKAVICCAVTNRGLGRKVRVRERGGLKGRGEGGIVGLTP